MNLLKTSLALIVLISSFQTLAKAEENNEWITKKKQSSSIIKKKDSSFITKKKGSSFITKKKQSAFITKKKQTKYITKKKSDNKKLKFLLLVPFGFIII